MPCLTCDGCYLLHFNYSLNRNPWGWEVCWQADTPGTEHHNPSAAPQTGLTQRGALENTLLLGPLKQVSPRKKLWRTQSFSGPSKRSHPERSSGEHTHSASPQTGLTQRGALENIWTNDLLAGSLIFVFQGLTTLEWYPAISHHPYLLLPHFRPCSSIHQLPE